MDQVGIWKWQSDCLSRIILDLYKWREHDSTFFGVNHCFGKAIQSFVTPMFLRSNFRVVESKLSLLLCSSSSKLTREIQLHGSVCSAKAKFVWPGAVCMCVYVHKKM